MPIFTWLGYVLAWLMVILGALWVAAAFALGGQNFVLPGLQGDLIVRPGQFLNLGGSTAFAGVALGVLSEISRGINRERAKDQA